MSRLNVGLLQAGKFDEKGILVAGQQLTMLAPDVYDEAKTLVALKQNLGINLDLTKSKSIAQAIKDPTKFINDRETAIDDAAKVASKSYIKYLQNLVGVGVPLADAEKTALDYAETIYKANLNIYDLAHPGYGASFGSEVADRKTLEAKRDLYLLDRKAYKNKVIAKHEAKKARS